LRLALFARLGFRLALVIESGWGDGGVFSIRKRTSSRLLRGRVMAKPSGKSETSVSRRLPSGDRKRGLQKHTKLVGEVVWAWSQLHLAFAFAFARLHRGQSWVGQAIWTALKNDSAQRDILKAALPVSDATARQAKGLEWAISETGRLSGYRNDIVHGAMGWRLTPHGMEPSFSYFGNPPSRLVRYMARETEDGDIMSGPDIRQLMLFLRGDIVQLSGYVSDVARGIGAEKPQPLPRKPIMLAHSFVLQAQGMSQTRKRNQARGIRPKPSRG
jgi:hypothetical protein